MKKSRRMSRPKGSVRWRGASWWVRFAVKGKRFYVNTRITDPDARSQAEDVLRVKMAEALLNRGLGPVGRLTFDDLATMLTNHYQKEKLRSLDRLERSLAHLRKAFGGDAAESITPDRVDAYIAARMEEKASDSTIQKELAALSRMFAVALKKGRITSRPYIARMTVENTRTTSFSDAELARLLDVLAHGRPGTAMAEAVSPQPDLVGPVMFAAATGWRTKSDVLPLRWRQVDFEAGTVSRPGRGTSKARETILFPFAAIPELAEMLEHQRQATARLERERGRIVEHVFHRNGKRISDFRAAWNTACKAAGVPGYVFHDLRRTAARKLRALGMSDRDIAELVGWGADSNMVTRYLGRDPSGIADRLALKVQASRERLGDKRGTSGTADGPQSRAS